MSCPPECEGALTRNTNPLSGAVLIGLRIYKVLFSPLFAGSCRFEPSCSEYAAEAVRRHGVTAGCWLSIRRLARCHPFGSSGWDPVPPGILRDPSVSRFES